MRILNFAAYFSVAASILSGAAVADAQLQTVASFQDQQVTGVAVSQEGRVFVNFPNWSDNHTTSVAEMINGNPVPYPNEEWNAPGAPGSHFVCVQSVYVDAGDNLWILDPAAPKSGEVVTGGPKLLCIDLKTNKIVQTISFDEIAAPKKSYLNDVRVDIGERMAYITDSGAGALVVVDLRTAKVRRVLDNTVFTKGEDGFKLRVDGRELIEAKTGKPPVIHADGIALDAAKGYLYFHALTASTLYRVKTVDLKNASLPEADLELRVEIVMKTPPSDGMLMGKDGNVYLTDLEDGSVVCVDPEAKKISTVVADKALEWPDTMCWGPNDSLYVSASQIENSPRFNDGRDIRTEPYRIFKWTAPALPKSGTN